MKLECESLCPFRNNDIFSISLYDGKNLPILKIFSTVFI